MNELITVYSAELLRRLQSRMFWVGLILGIVGIVLLMKLPAFLDNYAAQSERVVLAGNPAIVARARPLLDRDFTVAQTVGHDVHPTLAQLRVYHASTLIDLSVHGKALQAQVFAEEPSDTLRSTLRHDLLPLNVELATGMPPPRISGLVSMPVAIRSVSEKFGSASQADSARAIAYMLLVLLYLLIMVNSQLIMSSVAEEKTSRIAELLVASVRPSALLAGKVAASGTLAAMQLVIWVATAYFLGVHTLSVQSGMGAAQSSDLAFTLSGVSSADVAGFGVFFILGFVESATLFAAMGSLINRTEDLGSVSGPLLLPVVAAFFIAIAALAAPSAPAVVITSFVPLLSPFVMFARIVVSSVPLWQVAVSFAINVAAIWGICVLGGKIYRIGMLLYGRPPRFGQILQMLRA